jgi:hypothetical protein
MHDAEASDNGFEASAHQAFDFLLSHGQFRCVVSRPDLVRYESASVGFEVGYSASYDHEVYARVGRLGVSGGISEPSPERLDFGLFLAAADPDEYAAIRRDVPFSIARSEGQVRRVLSHYAAGLKRCGAPLLSGDPSAYGRAHELRWWHAPDALRSGQQ